MTLVVTFAMKSKKILSLLALYLPSFSDPNAIRPETDLHFKGISATSTKLEVLPKRKAFAF